MISFENIKKIGLLIILIFVFNIRESISQEGKNTKDKNAKKKNVKEFTDKQLNEFIIKELEKKLKKIGRSKILNFSKELFKKEEDLKIIELDLKREKEKINLMKKNFEKNIKDFRKKQSKIIKQQNRY